MSNSVAPSIPRADHREPGFVAFPPEFVRRYRAQGWWSGQTLPADLATAAESHWTSRALVTPEREWTYAELFSTAACFARGLAQKTTLAAGDPVMFQMGNVAETVIAYLGALFAGLRPVCTLPQHGYREISLLAEHVGARGLFLQADWSQADLPVQGENVRSATCVEEVVVFRGDPAGPGHRFADLLVESTGEWLAGLPFHDLDPDQIAVFQLSGGTTGLPKVAPRMHEEYAYNARAWADSRQWGGDDVVLYVLPIMHNAGIEVALQPVLFSGATLVLSPLAKTELVLELIEQHRPNSFPLVPPAVAIRLLDHPSSSGVDFSCIREFIVGGQKLPQEIVRRLSAELSIDVLQKFGMAEGMFLVTPPDAPEQIRQGTVGTPISPGDEVRLLEPGTDRAVPDGEIGEFCARGPYTIRGYYRAEAHNAAAFTADGFYRTGDLAKKHVIEGVSYYSIEGRIKDVINRGAEKIHAEEVEEIMLRHPQITDAALVAMTDPVLGEKACAYLIVTPGVPAPDVAALGEFLLGQGLAKFKLPERIEVVEAMPLTNVGKIAKKLLREDVDRKRALESP